MRRANPDEVTRPLGSIPIPASNLEEPFEWS